MFPKIEVLISNPWYKEIRNENGKSKLDYELEYKYEISGIEASLTNAQIKDFSHDID